MQHAMNSKKVFDSEYYKLPAVCDLQIHVQGDITLKRFGVVDKRIDFIGEETMKPMLGYSNRFK